MNYLTTLIQRVGFNLGTKLAFSFSLIIIISIMIPALQNYSVLANVGTQLNQTREANERVRIAENANSAAIIFQEVISDSIKYGQSAINAAGNPSNLDLFKNEQAGYNFDLDTAASNFQALIQDTPTILTDLKLESLGNDFPNTISNLKNVVDNANSTDPTTVAQAKQQWQAYQVPLNTLVEYGGKFKDYTAAALVTANSNLNMIYQSVEATDAAQRNNLIIFSVILFMLAGFLGTLITSSITKPLGSLVRRLEGLAEGNLTERLYVANQDEFGRVAATFNSSVEKLNRLVSRLQFEADNIGRASSQINKASQEQAHSFAEQTSTVNELMQQIESLAEIARNIDSSSAEVATEAQQATHSAEYGQEAVNQGAVGMAEIQATVNEITRRILALNEKTQDAGKLVAFIESIAEETHLLALNAAIESAGAGEEGSRFSVVANRVRQLASRTREAVKNTQIILREIQLAAGSSVMATEQGLKRAAEGVELTHRSGEANETILQGVSRTAELSKSISNATTVQLGAAEGLVVKMRRMTETISENAFGAQQTTISAAQLDEIVEQLLLAAREFQVHTGQPVERTRVVDSTASQEVKNGQLVAEAGNVGLLNSAKTLTKV